MPVNEDAAIPSGANLAKFWELQGLPALEWKGVWWGQHKGSFFRCLQVSSPVRFTPRSEFNERCKPASRDRKVVKDICNVPRVELKLAGGKSLPEAVVKFGSLALREELAQFKIVRAVLVFLCPLTNGLKTAIRVLLQFLFLLFRAFAEYFRFAMGQCHGDGSQSTAQFLNLAGWQGCFSTHPFSALLVEINCGAIPSGLVLEYGQRFEWRPRTGQDGFHLGLLPWRGEPREVGLVQFHGSAQEALAVHTTLSVPIDVYCKPQHRPRKLVSLPFREASFGHFQRSASNVLVDRRPRSHRGLP